MLLIGGSPKERLEEVPADQGPPRSGGREGVSADGVSRGAAGESGGVRWRAGAAAALARSGGGRPAGLSEQAQPGRWARLTPPARRTTAQFLLEADLHGLLKLDTLIPTAPPAPWQRKAKESGPGPSPVGVWPVKPGNRSHSSSKTPSTTAGKSGSKIQSYPTKAGGDRYIPKRSTMQMEMANFLLTKENDPAADSPTKKEQQKAWAVNLNGFDVEEAKILHLRGKPQNAPEGCQNKLKVLYSQKMAPGSSRKNSRNIPSKPERVLDAPEMFNDYCAITVIYSSAVSPLGGTGVLQLHHKLEYLSSG
ncbi:cell division cycle protein 20 homolog [Ammospiza nelsoni]|uniref:cell division cycle protein 20 homolog n=1 Tax=Ammospiza nelsoni TaxID=2857394 RepID=UPI00286C9FBC|nr:cell division cycle protein 20 homolog [Ammospiza nelsoni]